jgi:hypothetical protein
MAMNTRSKEKRKRNIPPIRSIMVSRRMVKVVPEMAWRILATSLRRLRISPVFLLLKKSRGSLRTWPKY